MSWAQATLWSIVALAGLGAVGWLILRGWFGVGFYWEPIASSRLEIAPARIPVAEGFLEATLLRPASLDPGDAKLPAVVLVHGTSPQGRSLLLYRILARHLADRGAVVLLYDQRGYGESSDPARMPDGRYDLPWIADAKRAAEFLAEQPGVDARNVRLAGHSFGGSIALGVSREPGIECVLSRIVILSPGRGLPYSGEERFEFRARRLSTDMALEPPLTPQEARLMYEPMEVETLLQGRSALDLALLHSSEEEAANPLKPLIDQSDTTADFAVLRGTDHYLGTRRGINGRDFPIKIYDARPLDELIDFILVPYAEVVKDCGTVPDHRAARPAKIPSGPSQIGVQPDSRYLVTRNGESIILLGDSITQAWMELGSDFQHRDYIDALADRGLNATLIWSFIGSSPTRRRLDERIGYDAAVLWPWCGSVEHANFDLSCFNTEYFEQLRDFVAYAEERGVFVIVSVHDGWTKDRFDTHPFAAELGNGPLDARSQYVELGKYGEELPEDLDGRWDRRFQNQYFQERFCARLIEELDVYGNVIYEIFNEGEWYDERRRRQHELHFLSFFRARTNAPLASNADHLSGLDMRRSSLVDMISLHFPKWSSDTTTRSIFEHYSAETRAADDVKPVLFSETVPAFKGDPTDLEALTRVIWGTLLGGASITIQDDVSFRFAPRSRMTEHGANGDELLDRLGFAARFARETDLTKMTPESKLCSSGVCMAAAGSGYVAYAENEGEMWIDLPDAGRAIEFRWYNPRNGTYLGSQSLIPEGRVSLEVPFDDAVLYASVLPSEAQ